MTLVASTRTPVYTTYLHIKIQYEDFDITQNHRRSISGDRTHCLRCEVVRCTASPIADSMVVSSNISRRKYDQWIRSCHWNTVTRIVNTKLWPTTTKSADLIIRLIRALRVEWVIRTHKTRALNAYIIIRRPIVLWISQTIFGAVHWRSYVPKCSCIGNICCKPTST